MKKTRPGVIISPDEMNKHLDTVIIAPLTSTIKGYPYRVKVTLSKKVGEVALDHIKSIDKSRIGKKLWQLNEEESKLISNMLIKIFRF